MEAATAPEVAVGSKLKVKEVSPADAEPPQASPGQGAGSPTPQLLPPIEGDPWRVGRLVKLGGGSWGGHCHFPGGTSGFLLS